MFKILSHYIGILKNPENIARFIKKQTVKLPYYSGFYGYAFMPQAIKLYVNSKCNCRCTFCDVGKKVTESVFSKQMLNDNSGDIPMTLIKKMIHDFGTHRPEIYISGLEPLLHPDIIGILNEFKKSSFRVNLVTNGVLLNKFAAQLMALDINRIVVSIDGDEETHDKIRGNGIYKAAIEGLKNLNDAKSKLRAKTKIVINCCIAPENQNILFDFATNIMEQKLAEKLSFTFLYFITPEACQAHNRDFGHLGRASVTNFDESYKAIDSEKVWSQLTELKRLYGYKINVVNKKISSSGILDDYLQNPTKSIGSNRCLIPWTRATIMSDGNCIIHNRCVDYNAGNMSNQPFNKIWNGTRYRNFRKNLRKSGITPACIRCCGTVN
jgi:MoaA/NifB/PqqE/SkfB family radical SAM enzyme